MSNNTSYDDFANEYDLTMGNSGDFFHKNTCDPALLKVIGEVKDKTIYDLGCGNGYLSRYLIKQGTKEIWASDISPKLIEIAKSEYPNPDNKIKYFVNEATNFKEVPQDHFDLVFMNMVIHYVEDIPKLAKGLFSVLKNKSRFVFTIYNPTYPITKADLEVPSSKETDPVKEVRKYFAITEGKKVNNWSKGPDLDFFFRPISYYINILTKNGFLIDTLLEPNTLVQLQGGETKSSPIPGMAVIGATKITL